MSKIEKALEKAVVMRESMQYAAPNDIKAQPDAQGGTPVFEIGESIVDPALVDKHIVCVTDPYSPDAEQYRKLRARLIRDTAKDFRNIIMTASANRGEGKTVTSINLAASLAQEIDHTVLLVDADLRMPSIHKYLGIDPKQGLSDYLKGEAQLSDALIRTGIGKLVLLPAGSPAENPAELLSSAKMRDLVREMKTRYKDRYIIFDSSPTLITADALSLSRYMDGIIFVIQADQTPQKDVIKALSLIKGVPILGAVLNNVPQYLSEGLHSYSDYNYAYIRKPDDGGNGKNPG